MASRMKKKRSGTASASRQNTRRGKRRNPGTKIVVIGPKQNRGGFRGNHRPRRNPTFFGASVTPIQVGQYVLGGLIGVTINRIALPLLPASIAGSNIGATLAAFAIAAGEWWLASMIDKNFGAAVGFGALMNAGSQALNAFVPSVGSTISLSGRRGQGDFVPARFAVPQNPILDGGAAGTGPSMRSAYPAAYALAA